MHKFQIKEFTRELKKVASGLAKMESGNLPFMEKLSARDDVAKSLARCASMSRKIEDDFQKTTYRHNPKKLKEFSAGQDKLLRLQSRDKAVKERDAFQLYSSARQEDVRAIDAEQRTARRELLKKNPDANFNGGMVR